MRYILLLLLAISTPVCAEESDLNLRVGAIQQEFNAQIAALSNRAVALAAELASAHAKLKEAQAKECKEKKDNGH